MNVKQLKQLLQDALDNLEYYEEDEKIDIKTNTYFVDGDFISIVGKGFIELNNPVKEEEAW